MIRVVSFLCVALIGFTTLAVYHVSEQTRVARQDLKLTEKRIAAEEAQLSVLQAEWQKAAGPETIQRLAQASLGMNDTATVQLSSFSELPRRGDSFAALRSVSAQAQPAPSPLIKISVHSGM